MHIVELNPLCHFPPLSAQSPRSQSTAEELQFASRCLSFLELSKPAGIPGDDIGRGQDVVKEGNRRCCM
jgi:hypothetical protein